ncbi:MAG: oxidoreductase [Solirubrobacteraceae bacterium]
MADTHRLGSQTVRRLGFGAMQLPGPGVWGPPADREASIAVLRRAVELGVDHIDTAQFYGPDVANELIHEALHPYPDDLVIATKVGARRDAQGGWPPALAPEQLREDVLANIRSLGVERLAVVNLRLPDAGSERPIEEHLQALLDMREEGLIDAIGVSMVSLEQFEAARAVTPLAEVQCHYNVLNRSLESLVDACGRVGVAFVPFFPLGAAWTTEDVLGNAAVAEIAGRHGATPAQVALAWLLGVGEHVLPIAGTSSVAHLEENLAAGELELAAEARATLDELGAATRR